MDMQAPAATEEDRKNWIALLGSADPADLETALKNLAGIEYTGIVKPESGMLMVQARADGTGSRFNLGEVTVSRCILEVSGKYQGVGWIMGSDLRHAKLAALFDGLLQDPRYRPVIEKGLLSILEEKQKARDNQLLKDASDTRVEFFTLKRGE